MVIIISFSRLYNINIKLFDILNYCIINNNIIVIVYNNVKHKAMWIDTNNIIQ